MVLCSLRYNLSSDSEFCDNDDYNEPVSDPQRFFSPLSLLLPHAALWQWSGKAAHKQQPSLQSAISNKQPTNNRVQQRRLISFCWLKRYSVADPVCRFVSRTSVRSGMHEATNSEALSQRALLTIDFAESTRGGRGSNVDVSILCVRGGRALFESASTIEIHR